MFDLHVKVSVVTGASVGLGRGFAFAMARQGADVAILARRKEKLDQVADEVRSLSVKCLPVKCDVNDLEEVKAALDTILTEFGKVDILINNAGGGTSMPILEMTDEAYFKDINTDLLGLFKCLREFGKVMVKQGYGRIINIASILGLVGENGVPVAGYQSAKGGVVNLTRCAATELATTGVTVNAICPGFFPSESNGPAETEALAAIIASGESTTREPEYSQKEASHGANDYGDTYVEINLTGQHLFFYKEGKLVVESDFVSGNLAKGWGTPAGSYPLAYKQKNAVLKGENYRTPVNYWMPFNNGIGMHDAKWRSSFGGTIYKTGGSHGCINLPPSVAKTIFDNISAGTPVICYNLPGTEKSTTSGTAKPAETKPAETTAPAETPAPAETQAPAPAETQAPSPAPTTAPTQAETKAPETAAPTQAGPGGPSGDNGGNIAVGPGA